MGRATLVNGFVATTAGVCCIAVGWGVTLNPEDLRYRSYQTSLWSGTMEGFAHRSLLVGAYSC